MPRQARPALQGFLSSIRVSIPQRFRSPFGHQGPPPITLPAEAGVVGPGGLSVPQELALPSAQPAQDDAGATREDGAPLPVYFSAFLPEFPRRRFPAGQDHLEILGFVAKGSFGPILKAKDKFTEKTYAVKVLPKSEILRKGVLQQTKEEVTIQRQHKHTFLHTLQDCWQTQRHLFIMCDYCSAGDLYTYWLLADHFVEEDVRLFAAELGSALGFLHNVGIIHRDLKMENILLSDQGHLRLADFGLSRRLRRGGKAFTICGTIQYMAPEVLAGGPYSHAADWWSLGVTLFALATGNFPVAPETDHVSMLKKVRECPYDVSETLSSALALLLTELLCKDPTNRLRHLDRFKSQNFFHGTSFDPLLLQKAPVDAVLRLRNHPDRQAKARRGLMPSPSPQDLFPNFDCDRMLRSPTTTTSSSTTTTTTQTDLSPTLAHMEQKQPDQQA